MFHVHAQCSFVCASQWEGKFWPLPNFTFSHSYHECVAVLVIIVIACNWCWRLHLLEIFRVCLPREAVCTMFTYFEAEHRNTICTETFKGNYLHLTSLQPPISSYRPGSLSFCVIEAIERMLHHLVETSKCYAPARSNSTESHKPSATDSRPPRHNAARWHFLTSQKSSVESAETNSCLQRPPRACRFPSRAGCLTFWQTAR